MSEPFILIPTHLAEAERERKAIDDRNTEAVRHESIVAGIVAELQSKIDPVRDPEAWVSIDRVCRKFHGMHRSASVAITPDDVSRILSEVLLGERKFYEVKT